MTTEAYVKNGIAMPFRATRYLNSSAGVTSSLFRDYTLPGSYDAGVKNSEWRILVEKHENAGSDRTAHKHKIKIGGGTLSSRWRAQSGPLAGQFQYASMYGDIAAYYAFGGTVLNLPALLPISESVRNGALNSFYKDLSNVLSPVNGGQIVAEGRKTARGLLSLGKGLIGKVTGFLKEQITYGDYVYVSGGKRRRKQIRDSNLKKYANKYLEFTFGIQPLIQDIEEIVEQLKKVEIQQYQKVRAGNRLEDVLRSYIPLFPGPTTDANMYFDVFTQDNFRQKASFYGMVKHEQHSGITPKLFGLGWKDFFPTVWELIPYSWMVDYFSNLAEWISSKTGLLSQLAWVNYSSVDEYVRTVRIVAPTGTPQSLVGDEWSVTGSGGIVELSRKRIQRDASPDMDLSLRLELPGLSSRKWLNLAALALAHSKLKTFLFKPKDRLAYAY